MFSEKKNLQYVLNQLIYQKPTISPKYMALLHKTCLVFECRIAHTRNTSTMFSGFFSITLCTMYLVCITTFQYKYYSLLLILLPQRNKLALTRNYCRMHHNIKQPTVHKKHHLQPQSLLQPSATTRHQTIILFGMNIRTLMTLGIQLAQCS